MHNEDHLCDELGVKLMAEHMAASPGVRAAGPHGSRLGDVFKELRAKGIPWTQIFALVGQIIPILLGGGDFAAILAAILALFSKPATAPQTP